MSVKTGCLHQLMMNSFSQIHPLQGTRPCFSIRRNLHLATYFSVFEKYNQTHLFPSKQKNKVVFATFVLALLETENPDGVIFENHIL